MKITYDAACSGKIAITYIKLTDKTDALSTWNFCYLRLCGYGSGANLIVTVNEEI